MTVWRTVHWAGTVSRYIFALNKLFWVEDGILGMLWYLWMFFGFGAGRGGVDGSGGWIGGGLGFGEGVDFVGEGLDLC